MTTLLVLRVLLVVSIAGLRVDRCNCFTAATCLLFDAVVASVVMYPLRCRNILLTFYLELETESNFSNEVH